MICVDASVAAKWLFTEDYSEQALALVEAAASARQQIIAPALVHFEVTNIICQRMRREGLSLEEAQDALRRLFTFPVVISSPATLSQEALSISASHNLPAAYDAHYMALAQLSGCSLWTDDQRLIQGLGGRLAFVRWIGDYDAGTTPL